jgi:uncharacterized protein YjiK
MQKQIDWGTALSLGAIGLVCAAIGVQAMTDAPENPREDPAAVASNGEQAPAEEAQPAAAGAEEKKAGADEKKAGEEKQPPDAEKAAVEDPTAAYRLNKPDATTVLPHALDEVSGLSLAKQEGSFWAVHDERGTLFRISARDGSILQELNIGKAGDYEGVEEVEGKVYVGRADGTIFVVDPQGKEVEQLDFKASLGKSCDMEGLGYEPSKKRLLLACKKESPSSSKDAKTFDIHGVDLASKELQKEPAFVISAQAIDQYVKAHPDRADLQKVKGKNFGPSGIAVHPKTGEIAIISGVGNSIVFLDAKGAVTRVDRLEPSVHPQPEGVTYGADGTLFITNEARGKQPQLHTFKPVAPAQG